MLHGEEMSDAGRALEQHQRQSTRNGGGACIKPQAVSLVGRTEGDGGRSTEVLAQWYGQRAECSQWTQ